MVFSLALSLGPIFMSCLSVREGPWSVLKSEGVVGAWSKHGKKMAKEGMVVVGYTKPQVSQAHHGSW